MRLLQAAVNYCLGFAASIRELGELINNLELSKAGFSPAMVQACASASWADTPDWVAGRIGTSLFFCGIIQIFSLP